MADRVGERPDENGFHLQYPGRVPHHDQPTPEHQPSAHPASRGVRLPGELRVALIALAAALGLLVVAGCSSGGGSGSPTGGDRPVVVAAFYPLAYAAQQVLGDQADVVNLTPPGTEPHDLELTPAQVAQISEADLVLYVPGFMPALDEAIAQQAPETALDVTEGISLLPADHSGPAGAGGATANDPHVWLNPANMTIIGENISKRMTGSSGPAGVDAAAVAKSTTEFTAAMQQLTDEFTAGLATCRSRDLVVSHEAFGYLAQAFNLTQIGISGLSPEAEPSPARVAEVTDLVKSKGITTIYYETLVDPKVARTVAQETGAQTAVLDPIEGLRPGATGDYTSLMRANLATLRAGQGCT